jgi:hypothetical protein
MDKETIKNRDDVSWHVTKRAPREAREHARARSLMSTAMKLKEGSDEAKKWGRWAALQAGLPARAHLLLKTNKMVESGPM